MFWAFSCFSFVLSLADFFIFGEAEAVEVFVTEHFFGACLGVFSADHWCVDYATDWFTGVGVFGEGFILH